MDSLLTERYISLCDKYERQHHTLGGYIEFLNEKSLRRKEELMYSLEEFSSRFSDSRGFIDSIEKESVIDECKNLSKNIKKFNHIPEVSAFLLRYSKINNFIDEFNSYWISVELAKNDSLLSDIDNKSLDEQQRLAVVFDDVNNLVVAGAGSGKTLTIAGKVKYLVESRGYKPEEILLISFTSKSAQEMKERITGKLGIDVDVKTFHKLGLDIIAKKHKKKPDVSEDASELVHEYFREEIIKNPEKVDALVSFLSYYLKIPADIGKYQSLGAYIEENSDFDNETLREKYNEKREKDYIEEIMENHVTVKQEKVKSMEEAMIANFLFLNGVEYEYEREYEINTADEVHRVYKPDFYLPDYGIYIEHYGLNKDGRAPWLTPFKEEQYVSDYH